MVNTARYTVHGTGSSIQLSSAPAGQITAHTAGFLAD